jgi:hypothetical protein
MMNEAIHAPGVNLHKAKHLCARSQSKLMITNKTKDVVSIFKKWKGLSGAYYVNRATCFTDVTTVGAPAMVQSWRNGVLKHPDKVQMKKIRLKLHVIDESMYYISLLLILESLSCIFLF